MESSRYVNVHVDEILQETDKALLCRIGDEEVWIPLSQVADPDDYSDGDTNLSIAVTEWIAREKGLDAED